MTIDRTNTSFLGKWWWSIDRYSVICIFLMLALSAVLIMASSPSVAVRIGFESFYFIERQMAFIVMAFVVIFAISLLSPNIIRRLAVAGFAVCYALLIAVLFTGIEVKGAKRWIALDGFSLQPSEFIKTFLVVTIAGLLAKHCERPLLQKFRIPFALYVMTCFALILEPDFGMTVGITLVFASQLFIAGLPFLWIAAMAALSIIGGIGAYFFLPHVTQRINNFLDPASGDNYQISKSLQAFSSGGLYGRGPGEGVVKHSLPDAHTDFIFAVAGEELGMITCIAIILLFAFVVIRGLARLTKEENVFVTYAVSGLLIQFGMQAIINMSSTMSLIPTKGMTLPLISYGGSSMLSVALSLGMILALTRRRYGAKEPKSGGWHREVT